jgi:hypothetical protein
MNYVFSQCNSDITLAFYSFSQVASGRRINADTVYFSLFLSRKEFGKSSHTDGVQDNKNIPVPKTRKSFCCSRGLRRDTA